MSTRWNTEGRGPSARSAASVRGKKYSLRQRLDPVLPVGLLLLGLGLALAWWGVAVSGERFDWFETPAQRPLPDARLLVNVRDDIDDKPLLDAVSGSDGLWISQTGGRFHHWDPDTALWRTERPFESVAQPPDFVQLGVDPPETRPGTARVWALARDGSLALRDETWRLLTNASAFLDAAGKPVAQEDLSAAAVSTDGGWLALGTRRGRVGLFNLKTRTWRSEPLADMPGRPIHHLVWWRDRFWFGGDTGLNSAGVDGPVVGDERIGGRIEALEADERVGLWVLEKLGSVKDGQAPRTRVLHFDDPEQTPRVLLDNGGLFPELSTTGVRFAQQTGEVLLLAGDPGIFSYHTGRHTWDRLHDKAVGVTYAVDDGFFFGSAGRVGFARPNEAVSFPLASGNAFRIRAGNAGEVLALTTEGSVYGLSKTADPRLLFEPKAAALDLSGLTTAVGLGDAVLFSGPAGAMLHDIHTRRNVTFPKASGPRMISDANVRIYRSGDTLFGLTAGKGDVFPETLSLNRVKAGDFSRPKLLNPVTGPVAHVRDWDGQGLGMLDGEGRVFLLDRDTRRALTGPATASLNQGAILDVVELNQSLVVAGVRGIGTYDPQRRTWSQFNPLPGVGVATDIAAFKGELVVRDGAGRLSGLDRGRPVLIGGEPMTVRPSALIDALEQDDQIFLMDDRAVDRYDTRARRLTGSWPVASGAPPVLAGVVSNLPLFLSGGEARLGERVLDHGAGSVRNLSTNGYRIWSVRERRGIRYLHVSQSAGVNADCYFANPSPGPRVRQLLDAAPLDNGLTAVATNDGLRFYSRASRSWYAGPDGVMPRGGRLHASEHYLLLVEETNEGYDLWQVAQRNIIVPDSCSVDPVKFHFRFKQVKAFAVQPDGKEAAWINEDGEVVIWSDGQERTLLEAPGLGPDLSAMRGAYSFDGELMFTSDRSIHRYALAEHRWSRLGLSGPNQPIESLDLLRDQGQFLVTAKTTDGEIYLGSFAGTASSVALERLVGPGEHRFGDETITDAQGGQKGLWTFVTDRKLRFFDPITRNWLRESTFATSALDRTFCRGPGPAVVVENGGRRWHVARDDSAMPTDFAIFDLVANEKTALDQSGGIWRLQNDGTLLRGRRPSGDRYQDFEVYATTTRLDPRGVLGAWAFEDLLLLQGESGVSLLDRARGRALTLGAGIPRLDDVKAVRRNNRRFWVTTDKGILLLGLDQDGVQSRFFEAEALVVDRLGVPWAKFGERWLPWRDQDFEAVDGRLRSFAFEDARATAFDEEGYPYVWDDGWMRAPHALPETLEPSIIDALIAGADNDWWVVSGLNVRRLVPGTDPAGLPALVIDDTVTLDNDPGDWSALAGVRVAADSLELRTSRGATMMIRKNLAGGLSANVQSGGRVRIRGAVPDSWPELKSALVRLESGEWALNPITDLKRDVAGNLVAVRADGDHELGVDGVTQFKPGAALDVGWLKWLRDERLFRLATGDASSTIKPEDFVRDGRLLFEAVDAVLAENAETLHAANTAGVFTFQGGQLDLSDPLTRFRPQPMARPIRAAHGGFLAADRHIPPAGAPTAATLYRFNLGPVQFAEGPDGISVTLQTAGGQVSAVASLGFAWDQHRAGLVYWDDALWLRSDAGIHRPFDLNGVIPLPSGGGRLHPEARNGLMMRRGEAWLRWDGSRWVANVAAPLTDGDLLQDEVWRWFREGDVLRMVLADGTDLSLQRGPNGPSFTHDQLQDAVFVDDQLLVMTQAWFEIAEKGDLGGFRAKRLPASKTDRLEVIRPPGEPARVYRHVGARAFVWQTNSSLFRDVDPADDPRVARDLIRNGALWFRKHAGGVSTQLFTRDQNGAGDWTGFQWVGGRFPFDVINSVAADDERLYVASEAGLQIYTDLNKLSLAEMEAPVSPRDDPNAPVQGVRRLGFAPNRPQTLKLQVGPSTWSLGANGTLAAAEPLDEELCIASSLWTWTRSEDRTLAANYRARDGRAVLPLRIQGGRLPHDHIRDALVFDHVGFTLWHDGRVSVHPGGGIGMDNQTFILRETGPNPRRFVAVKTPVTVADRRFEPGVYLLDENGEARFYQDGLFQPVSGRGFAELIENPPLIAHDRFRLRLPEPGKPFQFEYRVGDRWSPIPWTRKSLPAMDVWRDLVVLEGRPWALTPMGLVAFAFDDGGRIFLDPDRFDIMTDLADDHSGSVTDLELLGSRLVARRSGSSKKVVVANVAQGRTPTFTPTDNDPFASATLVAADGSVPWTWRLDGREAGNPGVITVSLGDESPQIVAGRFPFDEVNALVFHEDGLHMAGPGGWWRTPADDLAVGAMARPKVEGVSPREIRWVRHTHKAGRPTLGLVQADGGFLRLNDADEQETVQALPRLVAQEGFRLYTLDAAGALEMTAARDGLLHRRGLQAGRFTDDVARGLPYPHAEGYLLPTAAGVLTLDGEGVARDLVSGPFSGLGEGEMPRAVFVYKDAPVYMGSDGFHQLDDGELVGPCQAAMPADAVVLSVTEDVHSALRFRWEREGQRGFSLVSADDLSPRPMDQGYIHVAQFGAFHEQRLAWGNPQPWIAYQFEAGRLTFQTLDGAKQTKAMNSGRPLNGVLPHGDRALVITPNEAWEINLETPLEQLLGPP